MSTAKMTGFIQAIASSHPLQTRLSLILTDFEPNTNKQGIPKSEAENIIRSALYMPVKINFDGDDYHGHTGAYPIGPIVMAETATDNGRDVIMGEAVIWNREYEDVAEHLKIAFAEGIGTSWEIFYDESKTKKDDNGIQWLEGCVFAGTCVVNTPAYGPERTRLLAIAETLHNRVESKMPVLNDKKSSQADSDVDALRANIGSVLDTLSNMYSGLYEMLDDTYEIEQELNVTDLPAMATQLTKLLSSIQDSFTALSARVTTGDAAEAELNQLKTKIAEAEELNRKLALENDRKGKLTEFGIELSEEKKEFYLSMSEDMFSMYLQDLSVVKGSKQASAGVKTNIIPEPVHTTNVNAITIPELAALIRGV